jgi:hypothetical protein
MTGLRLQRNARLTGEWRGEKPSNYDFNGTGITEAVVRRGAAVAQGRPFRQ